MKSSRLRGNRPLGLALSVAGTVALVGLLAATMAWTGFDPLWVPFLGGVLLAAVLATASRVTRAEWRLARRTRYAVNLSQASVRSADFARFVQDQLVEQYVDGGALCFEIAEHDFSQCHDDAARLIGELKPLGCRFTADAFGSVKGSFATLKGLAFDYVKVDGVLVLNLLRHTSARIKVSAVAEVCRKAGMRSIAEFVEDEAALAALREIGVDYAQGFGVGPLERLG